MIELAGLTDDAGHPIGMCDAQLSAYLALAAKLTKQLSAGLAVVDAEVLEAKRLCDELAETLRVQREVAPPDQSGS
jgi:hypothetical protein